MHVMWTGGRAWNVSEVYRKAHARDGINEMHPEILNRRISSQETGEMEGSRVRDRQREKGGEGERGGGGGGGLQKGKERR